MESQIWDAATGKELLTAGQDPAIVNGLVYSPDGTRVATANDDGAVKVWMPDGA
jgi:WD40 repeat protein